jgi:hypothetical protein
MLETHNISRFNNDKTKKKKKKKNYYGIDQGWPTYKYCKAAALPQILGKVKLNV